MKQAINTRTQEEYDALMRYYESKGFIWSNGKKATKNKIWPDEKENTCVLLDNNDGEGITYCGLDFVLDCGFQIIPYTEFAKANIVEEKPKSRLFDPKVQQPIPSEDCPEFSVDVFIIDENEMHGLACYHFEDKKWMFHTDTLVDYNEVDAETKWKWYYPDVQWSEEATETDYKALYLEGRKVIKQLSFAAQITGGVAGKDENLQKAIELAETFLTKHNVTPNRDGE